MMRGAMKTKVRIEREKVKEKKSSNAKNTHCAVRNNIPPYSHTQCKGYMPSLCHATRPIKLSQSFHVTHSLFRAIPTQLDYPQLGLLTPTRYLP